MHITKKDGQVSEKNIFHDKMKSIVDTSIVLHAGVGCANQSPQDKGSLVFMWSLVLTLKCEVTLFCLFA